MARGPGREWWREAVRNKKARVKAGQGVALVDARNPRDETKPLRYYTRSIAVPPDRLLAAITKSLTFTWPLPQS